MIKLSSRLGMKSVKIVGIYSDVNEYIKATRTNEDKSYEATKDDPKWDEVLIDSDKTLTRKQIRDHYKANSSKILKEIGGKPVMLYIGTNKNENILKRKHNDKSIAINNEADLMHLADRRLLSIHRIFEDETDLGFVDLDLHGGYEQSKAKEYAKQIASKIKVEYKSNPIIYSSGGDGFHIEFKLDKKMKTDTLRNELRELCEELNKDFEGATTGIVKGKGMRTDTTTLKNNGNIRIPFSIHESSGGVKKPVDISDNTDDNWKDQLPGGLADKKKPEDFDQEQLSKGIEVELEHVDNRQLSKEIAMDHLMEDEKYYDKLEEMEKGSSLLFSKRAKKDKPKAGVFIVLPKNLAKQFPSLGEHDDSEPHVTALFIGAVQKNKHDTLVDTVKEVAANTEPFEIELDDKASYFPASKHSDDCKVAKVNVKSNDLHKLHKALKKALTEAGIDIDDHWPDYKPHVTLEYMEPPKDKYDNDIPSGMCNVKEIEIWGVGSKKIIQLGKTSNAFLKTNINMSKRANTEISLTSKEKEIFDILLGTIKEFNLGSTIRVAGGWVRDKFMGKNSNDLDIAVDNMSGKDFASKVVSYALKYNLPVKSVGVIEARPDQSKHLETAVVNILGENIDFVALRAEKYDPKTRIPLIAPGTALEDAYRRDFTINSLFYVINTGKIEDLTGTGVSDIKNGVIRTPVPPKDVWSQVGITDESNAITSKKTFLDDPLRILRAIRFASRYGFELSPDIINAAKDPQVQEAFRNKISRERIEIEFRKMLGGANPVMALQMIKDLGLRSEVLKLPEEISEWEMDQNNPHHQLNIWDHVLETLGNLQEIIKNRNLSEADKFVLNLSAFLHDVGKLDPNIKGVKEVEGKIVNTYYGHEEASMRLAEYMLRSLPGVRVDEIERVKKLIDGARRVNPNRQDSSAECNMARKQLGKLVRLMGDDWENAIDVGMADATAKKKNWFPTYDQTYYKTMKDSIRNLDLEQAASMRPLINGNEMMQMFQRKGGKWISVLIKELIDWQLENPKATKQDAGLEIKKMYSTLELDKVAEVLISKRACNIITVCGIGANAVRVR